ncbi:MAG: DUF2520 domain-containing protein [Ignavibacteriaceae bacterium]
MFSLKSEIAVIGAGRISYSLANALVKSSFRVTSIISRSLSSSKRLAVKFKIKNYSSDSSSLTPDIKILFLAVPDDQILSVAQKISKLTLDFKNSIFIHLSGAEDVSVLNILRKKSAHAASFHIMQTFPERKIISLTGSYTAIETNSKTAESFLFRLAKKLSLLPFKISSQNKIYYHIAGVYASNFLVANQYYAAKLFGKTKSGMDYKKIFSPITEMTLRNIEQNGAINSVSGPVERGDIKTVKKHLKALRNDNLLRANYICQSLTLLELLKKRNKKLTASHKSLKNYLTKQF